MFGQGLSKPYITRVLSSRARGRLGTAPNRNTARGNKAINDDGFLSVQQLPLFPLKPGGVFLPGMTKTLHLYEPHFVDMMKEVLENGQNSNKLMATAVLEPYVGQEGGIEGAVKPGNFVGGDNFMITNGCLVKVLDAKPYMDGYLARIRGEGRLGVSGLPQVMPYMRAHVFNMADMPVSEDRTDEIKKMVLQLEGIMRDIQNLSSKYRSQETASIQQAMFWVNLKPIAPSVMAIPSLEEETNSSAQQDDEDVGEPWEALLDRAARMSWAALQWLPESTDEEKMLITRSRLLAMETQDLKSRLQLAIDTMQEASSSLAAKCALKSLGPIE